MMGQVEALLKLYANEKYILTVNQQLADLKFYVSFKVFRIMLSLGVPVFLGYLEPSHL